MVRDVTVTKGSIYKNSRGSVIAPASAKPIEWALKSSAGGFVQSELKCRGNKIIDSSATNTATQLDAVTYDERTNHVKYEVQNVKMNAESAGDVTSATALEVTGVEVEYKRTGHDGIAVSGYSDIAEPAEGGYPDIRIKLKFPHFDAVNKLFLATAIAETTQKMLIGNDDEFSTVCVEVTVSVLVTPLVTVVVFVSWLVEI